MDLYSETILIMHLHIARNNNFCLAQNIDITIDSKIDSTIGSKMDSYIDSMYAHIDSTVTIVVRHAYCHPQCIAS